tara:strand:- start:93 stop:1013 length:921 start_codon:yes stop_codon:yes gene_type:complete
MTIREFLHIVEIRTKVVSVSGFAIGAAYAWYRFGPPDPVALAVMFSAVLAVDMATTGFNTFFDFFFGVDRRTTNREQDKVLVHQGVAAGPALLVSLSLYAVAAVLGIVLAVRVTPWVIPIGAVGMLVGFLYNAGPRPISSTPLGELFAGGFLGWVLVVLTIFVLSDGRMRATDLLAGVPSFLFVASILTVNNTCDIDGDRHAGRQTLSIVLGRPAGEALVYLFGGLAFASAVALAASGIWPRIVSAGVLLAALIAVPQYYRMHLRGFSHDTKGPSMGAIARIFRWYSLGVTVPLLIAAAGWLPGLL